MTILSNIYLYLINTSNYLIQKNTKKLTEINIKDSLPLLSSSCLTQIPFNNSIKSLNILNEFKSLFDIQDNNNELVKELMSSLNLQPSTVLDSSIDNDSLFIEYSHLSFHMMDRDIINNKGRGRLLLLWLEQDYPFPELLFYQYKKIQNDNEISIYKLRRIYICVLLYHSGYLSMYMFDELESNE